MMSAHYDFRMKGSDSEFLDDWPVREVVHDFSGCPTAAELRESESVAKYLEWRLAMMRKSLF
jgi:hypothetical protein